MRRLSALGMILYDQYFLLFQLAGLILLVAMIGAIVLTLRHRSDVKRQDILAQIYRDPAKAMELRDAVLRELERSKESLGISNPLDAGIEAAVSADDLEALRPFEPEMADLAGAPGGHAGREQRRRQVDALDLEGDDHKTTDPGSET